LPELETDKGEEGDEVFFRSHLKEAEGEQQAVKAGFKEEGKEEDLRINASPTAAEPASSATASQLQAPTGRPPPIRFGTVEMDEPIQFGTFDIGELLCWILDSELVRPPNTP
jgi:hypothetical protein